MQAPNQTYKKVLNAPAYLRIPFGTLLMAGGLLFFLPVLGLWMFPLGLFVCLASNPKARQRTNRWEPLAARSEAKSQAAARLAGLRRQGCPVGAVNFDRP